MEQLSDIIAEIIIILILISPWYILYKVLKRKNKNKDKNKDKNVKSQYENYIKQQNAKNQNKEYKNNQEKEYTVVGEENKPYKLKYILTQNEYLFYKELKKITDKNNLIICPKVGLKDLFQIETSKDNYMKYFGKIAQKHFDFIICDKNLYPMFAIELDDKSHNTEKGRISHEFKNEIIKQTRFKMLRIKAKQTYDYEYVYNGIKTIYTDITPVENQTT